MRSWPLRWKIALYAAALGVIATLAGAATTWTIMYRWQVRAFDERLASDAREMFRDVANFRPAPDHPASFNEIFIPLALHHRFVQVENDKGEIVYRSPNLPEPISSDGIAPIHNRNIAGRKLRIGEFRDGSLTALIGAETREVDVLGWQIILGMVGAIPTVLVVVGVGGRWVASRALGPVEQIRQAAARITPQNLAVRLPSPSAKDEIAGLVSVLNQTFDRLERSFAQSVRFSAEASHHLKTPLAVLRAGIEEILTGAETTSDQQDKANALLHQVHQLTSIAENLLLLARADAGRLEFQIEEFDLHEVLDGMCDDARALSEPEQISLEAHLPPALPIKGDRRSIALVIQNLVENAVKYNEPGGMICIFAERTNGHVQVRIRNNGTPIPPERAPHIFERFYRGRSDSRISGSGLGLSIACELTKALGGALELVRSDSEWTEFLLSLPVSFRQAQDG